MKKVKLTKLNVTKHAKELAENDFECDDLSLIKQFVDQVVDYVFGMEAKDRSWDLFYAYVDGLLSNPNYFYNDKLQWK